MGKRGYRVPPCSRREILNISKKFREVLGLGDQKNVNVLALLETMYQHDLLIFECCEDAEVCDKGEGFYDPVTSSIILPDSVYSAAYHQQGRARFTVAHELGHFFLNHSVQFGRNDDTEWKAYQDSEWQADTFAGFFLAPPNLVNPNSSVDEIAVEFGLSFQAADIVLQNAKKARHLV